MVDDTCAGVGRTGRPVERRSCACEPVAVIRTCVSRRPARVDIKGPELEPGGAIFAVGSITFCGSLSHNRYENNVSRILKNVLDRFTAATPEIACGSLTPS